LAGHVETLRRAYAAWNESLGANRQVWLDLASDDFEMQSVAPRPQGLQFAGDQVGRRALDYYLATLIELWEMRYYRVDAIFGDENQAVMVGECRYAFRANGQVVTTPIANLWTFRNGKAVACVEIFDSAQAVAVASMPAASPA
jgi:ketosteroid isomerase-like protein